MRTLNDRIQIVRVVVHIVFAAVLADCLSNLVLEIVRDRVLAGVHMRDLGPFQAFRKLLPRVFGNVICLANVQTPNVAGWLLKYSEQMKDLLVFHSNIEILCDTRKIE